jgi:putative cardiolipin synthase
MGGLTFRLRKRSGDQGVNRIANIKMPALVVLAAVGLSGCVTLPDNSERTTSHYIADTGSTIVARLYRAEKSVHPDQSGFHLLSNGHDALVARATLARFAEKSIDVQYYLYHTDSTGRALFQQLKQAADRDVRVRILLDDIDLGDRDALLATIDDHPNIEVRVFNPFSRDTPRLIQFVSGFGKVTRRMHNKSFTVDNQATIVGGRNIGNEYFEAHPDLAFSDLDVLAIGPVVDRVSNSFDEYWNHQLAYPISILVKRRLSSEEFAERKQQAERAQAEFNQSDYFQKLKNSRLANDLRSGNVRFSWGEADVVYDSPDKLTNSVGNRKYMLAPQLTPHIAATKNEFTIFSAYFVPGKEGVQFFRDLRDRGVRVRIMTNSLSSNDVAVVHAGYQKYRKRLLAAGVELYEIKKQLTRKERKEKKGKGGSSKASLHAKSFVMDRERLLIGSINLDPRSLYENTELGIVFDSPKLAGGMADWFDRNADKVAYRLELKDTDEGEKLLWHDIDGDSHVVHESEPNTGFWRRFLVGLASILPFESQL